MSDTPRTDAAILDEHDPAESVGALCARLEIELSATKAELHAAQVAAMAMRKALSLVVPTCESLHHPPAYRHTATMPCKACDVVRKAMAL